MLNKDVDNLMEMMVTIGLDKTFNLEELYGRDCRIINSGSQIGMLLRINKPNTYYQHYARTTNIMHKNRVIIWTALKSASYS
jgi:hypothetical protein